MREILFRGVDEDGAWRHGFYVRLDEEIHAVYTGEAEHDCGALYPVWYEVNPRTVGQYTGFKDSNGAKIFEGDVIKFRVGTLKAERRAIVEFENGVFVARTDKRETMRLTALHEYTIGKLDVIGNIHDDPELMREILG